MTELVADVVEPAHIVVKDDGRASAETVGSDADGPGVGDQMGKNLSEDFRGEVC